MYFKRHTGYLVNIQNIILILYLKSLKQLNQTILLMILKSTEIYYYTVYVLYKYEYNHSSYDCFLVQPNWLENGSFIYIKQLLSVSYTIH